MKTERIAFYLLAERHERKNMQTLDEPISAQALEQIVESYFSKRKKIILHAVNGYVKAGYFFEGKSIDVAATYGSFDLPERESEASSFITYVGAGHLLTADEIDDVTYEILAEGCEASSAGVAELKKRVADGWDWDEEFEDLVDKEPIILTNLRKSLFMHGYDAEADMLNAAIKRLKNEDEDEDSD